MMLGTSVMLLFFGLMALVYNAAHQAKGWGPEKKTAVWFTISFVFGSVSYFIAWSCTEKELQDLSIKAETPRNGQV